MEQGKEVPLSCRPPITYRRDCDKSQRCTAFPTCSCAQHAHTPLTDISVMTKGFCWKYLRHCVHLPLWHAFYFLNCPQSINLYSCAQTSLQNCPCSKCLIRSLLTAWGLFSESYCAACRKIHSQNAKADVKTNHVLSGKAAKKD